MTLGTRIVRELGIEKDRDTLGRWMAHHLAEVMEEAEKAEENRKEEACQRAVDLILKLWSHRRNLPRGVYPLNDLESVMSVIGRLREAASPFRLRGSDEIEQLLGRIFKRLCLVVGHGVMLVSGAVKMPPDLDLVAPFLDERENQFLEVMQGWIDYLQSIPPQPPDVVVVTEQEKAFLDSRQTEMHDLEKLDPRTRSNRIFFREIEQLMEALSKLKLVLNREDGESG